MSSEPVFLVGCIRSGTTILHTTLTAGCPSAIDLDDEDFEGRTFWQARGYRIGSPRTGTRCDAADGLDLTDERRGEIVEWCARRTTGGRHIVNKNPHLSNKIGLIHRLFPRARIVHVVREVPAVVASTKRRFEASGNGHTYWRAPFVYYWPGGVDLPCWWVIPAEGTGPMVCRESSGRRVMNLVRGSPSIPAGHEAPEAFRRRFPDGTRYFPGEGFRRLPESWLSLNANVIRQVESLAITHLYLPVNYASLVERTKETIRRIAEFSEIERVDLSAVPETLDTTRRHQWRHTLRREERDAIDQVVEVHHADAQLIRDRLPGPLFVA